MLLYAKLFCLVLQPAAFVSFAEDGYLDISFGCCGKENSQCLEQEVVTFDCSEPAHGGDFHGWPGGAY